MTEDPSAHEVIEMPNRLAEKADPTGGPSQAEIEAALQAQLFELREQYPAVVREICETLRELVGELRCGTEAGAGLRAIHAPFHDLKGHAASLDFPLIGEAAAAVCELIRTKPDVAASHPDLLEVYVKAIDLMAVQRIRDASDRRGAVLIAELQAALERTIESRG